MLSSLERRRVRATSAETPTPAGLRHLSFARLLAGFVVLVLFATGCGLFGGSNPQGASDNPGADGEASGETAPTSSTVPPILSLQEAAEDPAFDGGNSDGEATSAMEVLLDNELDFNAPGLADGVGECSAINGGVLSQFLGADVVVDEQRLLLTPAPQLSCRIASAADSGVTVGFVHVSPDDGGFGSWYLTNPAADLTAVVGPGDTAGWTEGTSAEQYFSILVVEQGGTQVAMEYRTFEGGTTFVAGKVPAMVGALSQATADLAA